MLSKLFIEFNGEQHYRVLILIVMEHALGVSLLLRKGRVRFVLILIVMEHALGDLQTAVTKAAKVVLILIVMEHALGDSQS